MATALEGETFVQSASSVRGSADDNKSPSEASAICKSMESHLNFHTYMKFHIDEPSIVGSAM